MEHWKQDVGLNQANMGPIERSIGGITGGAAPSESTLSNTVMRFDPALTELHGAIDELTKKLEPITRPPSPNAQAQNHGPSALSPLGDHLLNQVLRIEGVTGRLRDLLRRIDL